MTLKFSNRRREEMRKFISMLLLFQAVSSILFSQIAPEKYLPSMPSPTVASLAKYADFPEVDQFGLAPLSIPIYEVKVKDFTLPISLSYHASGIRVSQESSWVGLGFDLDGLCFITRTVRDLPDDLDVRRNLTGTPSTSFDYHGRLKNPDFFENFPNLSWAQGSNDEAKSAHVLGVNDGSPRTLARNDAEPDIFFLNIGPLREKFIFDHDGNIVLLEPNSKLKITRAPITNWAKGIREFTVTDTDGNKYIFGSVDENNAEVEETTVKSEYMGSFAPSTSWNGSLFFYWQNGGAETRTFRTTWFIREIIVQSNNESINFTYQSATEEFNVPMDQYYIKQNGSSDPLNPKPILHLLWSGLKSIKHTTKTKYLEKIHTDNIDVDFTLNSRTDLKGGKRLNKIKVNTLDGTVEECEFTYETKTSVGDGDAFNLNRLYLSSLTLKGKSPYVFYYSPIEMPDKRSAKQDYWGFTCSKSTSLIPRLYVYPNKTDHLRYSTFPIVGDNNYTLLTGSDRSMDLTSVLAGSLHRVKLPTGGYDELLLEPNDFYDPNWGQVQGAGLRIKEIRKLDRDLSLIQKKVYKYKNGIQSSGTLLGGLGFAVPTAYSIPDENAALYNSTLPDVWDRFTLRKSSNYFPLVNHDGALVAYTNVSIVETGNGKIEKTFYAPKNFLSNATPVKWAKNYTLDPSFLDKPADSYQDLNKKISINFRHYGMARNDSMVSVSVYELISGNNWNTTGVNTSAFQYYFEFDGEMRVLTHSEYFNYANPMSIVIYNDASNTIMGQVQKYGNNIFPFPPISDDGNVNAGKLKDIKYFKEDDFVNPIDQVSYSYAAVGVPTTVYGLVFAPAYVCNVTLGPLPLEKYWAGQYNWNSQYFVLSNMHMYLMPKNWAKYTIIGGESYFVSAETSVKSGVTQTAGKTYTTNLMLRQLSETTSQGATILTRYKYADDYSYITSSNPVNKMKDLNIVSRVIEKDVTHQKDGVSKLVFAELNMYRLNGSGIVLDKIATYKPNTTDLTPITSTVAGSNFVPDGRYVTEMKFDQFDSRGNLIQYTSVGKIQTSFIWGYNNLLPIAKVENAISTKAAFTGFETNGDMGGFSYINTTGSYYNINDVKTGKRSYYLFTAGSRNDLAKNSLPIGDYIVSYWAKGTGAVQVYTQAPVSVSANWKYYETKVQLSATGNVALIGSGTSVLIDEVRLCPVDAKMTTFTYAPFVGITSITDTNGVSKYFEYDDAGRLSKSLIDSEMLNKKTITQQFLYWYVK